MKRQTKLTEQQELAAVQQSSQESVREFATVEEMLRHDALHTPVPPSIAHRLQQSLPQSSSASQPWWKRLLGQ